MTAESQFANIPGELRQLPQWVCWRIVQRDGKPTKMPVQPSGAAASSTDPKTWSTFEHVCKANGQFAGIGFVFTKQAGYTGIDLDKCRNPKTGETEEWALGIIGELDSYTELSQSLMGLHVIVKGSLPRGGNRRGRMEMYDHGRFFCMTGARELGRHTVERRDLRGLQKRMLAGEFGPRQAAASKVKTDESIEDFRLIGEVQKQMKTSDPAALEEAFRKRHPERYAARNREKGDRAGKNYFCYSIQNFLRGNPAATESDAALKSGELPTRIRAVVLDNTIPLFDKRRRIAELIEDALQQRGEFCRTADERLFFFETGERRLYDLEEICFGRMLTNLCGLSATESFYKFALDTLQARQARQARLAEVHSFAYHDPETSLLAVSDGAGGVWFRERGGQWRLGSNGEQGLYFVTEREGSPWVPEFGATPDALDWLLKRFCFADALLSGEEARIALTVWVFQQFFPELRRTRIIPTFLGPQGSGKTTGERLVGRLLLGPSFDVTGVQREREDAFVAAVTNRVVLGLDNADSKIPWLADSLALYATGQKYRLRRLYTTNEEVSYVPRAILMISSRDPQFNRPDVSERLLPIHCERPDRYFTEAQIFDDLQKRRGAVMGALLNQVARIADSLAEVEPQALSFRMADFASFGERVFRPTGRSGEWLDIMGKVERAQSAFASEGDGIVTAILELVARDGDLVEVSIGDLFKRCCDLGEKEGIVLPRSLQGFGRALTTRRRVIELEGGVHFQEFRGEHRRRFITIRKGASKDAGAS